MAMADRSGTFKAEPIEWGMAETGQNNLATFIVLFRLTNWLDAASGDWPDWSAYDQTITAYLYLEKRDGTPNEVVIEQIKQSLGWDGLDVRWLQQADLSGVGVQLELAYEQYQGRNRLHVQWLNPPDWAGSRVQRADDTALSAIQGRLGGKLRALATPAADAAPLQASSPPGTATVSIAAGGCRAPGSAGRDRLGPAGHARRGLGSTL